MRRVTSILPCICLALVSVAAKADSTLTFDSSSGSIGPYSMTLNPGDESLKLFCMNDNLYINSGETWSVDVIEGSGLGGNTLTSSHATQYEEEAFILSEASTYGDTAVQDALWKVFDSSDHLTGAAATLYGLITSSSSVYTSFISTGGYDNYVFYIYNGDSITGRNSSDRYSDPQNFIGNPPAATPEPSSLALLGSGVLGLAGVVRRRFGK